MFTNHYNFNNSSNLFIVKKPKKFTPPIKIPKAFYFLYRHFITK